jgi:hypothetical protein
MKNKYLLSALPLLCCASINVSAQSVISSSYNINASAVTDRTVLYNLADSGTAKHILFGLDTAWPSAENIKRGITYMGKENIDIVRASFQPSHPLENNDLTQKQIDSLNIRLNLINLISDTVKVALNDDPMDGNGVNSWYKGNADRWAQLIDATTKRVQASGHPVISVAPFNEPDYGWNQGTITDFGNIAAALKKNARFDTIRISGGNTLNDDQALPWYNTLKSNLDEGNTHQLAGSFDNFASFYQQVRSDGKFATGDELHNVMEPMVGAEYGMQEGIWWGTAEHTRGEFVKASKGVRLGYAEHRTNWTAASVYRNPQGQVIGFGGTSERQAATTTYKFASKDRDVYYDGYGPTREFTMTLPGGTGYQTGQSNAEGMVNISYGEDIQPAINGKYYIVNRQTGYVLFPAIGNDNNGATVNQYRSTTSSERPKWNITPVSTTVGGDFSYFTITSVSNGKSMDDLNWSLDNGTGIIMYDLASGNNQQWFLEYADNGYFYIRNRHSGKCLQISSKSLSSAIIQNEKNDTTAQQWRLIPVGITVETTPPDAPSSLTATANAASVQLNWTASAATDLKGYDILRANTADGNYNTIARYVTTTSFVDNTANAGTTYSYKVRAQDKCYNNSDFSNIVTASVTDAKALVAEYNFEDSTQDNSMNMNDCSIYSTPVYTTGKVGSKALSLNGTSSFVQLPYTVANHESMTISVWTYWTGLTAWQRIFDFGNGDSQYMFLTARSATSKLRFATKDGGDEQQLDASTYLTRNSWQHVAVTIAPSQVCLYVNGVLAASSTTMNIHPSEMNPIFNYIGRSQFASDPLFKGYIDDFRIYNYALTGDEVNALATTDGILSLNSDDTQNTFYTVYSIDGRTVLKNTDIDHINNTTLPCGTYIVKITNGQKSVMTKKIIIKK